MYMIGLLTWVKFYCSLFRRIKCNFGLNSSSIKMLFFLTPHINDKWIDLFDFKNGTQTL